MRKKLLLLCLAPLAFGLMGVDDKIRAADPACGSANPTCQALPSCQPECVTCKKIYVPVPFCHGIKRPWFCSTEPPRVDVLEAVAIRHVQAPVTGAALSFQIVQTAGAGNTQGQGTQAAGTQALGTQGQGTQAQGENSCTSSRSNGTAASASAATAASALDARLEKIELAVIKLIELEAARQKAAEEKAADGKTK